MQAGYSSSTSRSQHSIYTTISGVKELNYLRTNSVICMSFFTVMRLSVQNSFFLYLPLSLEKVSIRLIIIRVHKQILLITWWNDIHRIDESWGCNATKLYWNRSTYNTVDASPMHVYPDWYQNRSNTCILPASLSNLLLRYNGIYTTLYAHPDENWIRRIHDQLPIPLIGLWLTLNLWHCNLLIISFQPPKARTAFSERSEPVVTAS